jgi:hypothetical protein
MLTIFLKAKHEGQVLGRPLAYPQVCDNQRRAELASSKTRMEE